MLASATVCSHRIRFTNASQIAAALFLSAFFVAVYRVFSVWVSGVALQRMTRLSECKGLLLGAGEFPAFG